MEHSVQTQELAAVKSTLWPALPLNKWASTYKLIWLWSQIIGKIKLGLCTPVNHWWHVTLLVNATGLTTGVIPYSNKFFEIDLDFINHRLQIRTSDGRMDNMDLKTTSIAMFYSELKHKLSSLGIEVKIWPVPVEMDENTPFDKDLQIRIYDPEASKSHFEILMETDKILKALRSGFTGKSSQVHFFWGSFDLAVTFFSGRNAPEHPGIPNVPQTITKEAYSKELCSFGFWAGAGLGEPAFYAYAYPEPEDYGKKKIEPADAFYHPELREFILPYDAIREEEFPEQSILTFYKSAYAAAAETGKWDKTLYKDY